MPQHPVGLQRHAGAMNLDLPIVCKETALPIQIGPALVGAADRSVDQFNGSLECRLYIQICRVEQVRV